MTRRSIFPSYSPSSTIFEPRSTGRASRTERSPWSSRSRSRISGRPTLRRRGSNDSSALLGQADSRPRLSFEPERYGRTPGLSTCPGDAGTPCGCYEESLAVYRELGDRRGVASLRIALAMNAFGRGDYGRARRLAEESLEPSRDRFPLIEIPNYAVLGQVLVAGGDIDGGTELVRRGAELARDVGWDWWLSGQLGNLAFLALGRGDLDEAERTGAEALRLEREHGNRHWALYSLTALARVALARRDPERAGLYWEAVEVGGSAVPLGAWETSRIELADGSRRPRRARSSLPAESEGARSTSGMWRRWPSRGLRPSRRAAGSPTRTASCRRRGRARGRRARPGSSRRARG